MPAAFVRRRPSTRHGPLLWGDEFTGSALDTSKWRYAVDGDFLGAADGHLDPSAVTVSGGALHLTATNVPASGKLFTTGGILTSGKQSFGPYGYWEARIRFPSDVGTWATFWQLAYDYFNPQFTSDPYETWELDMLETLNHASGRNYSFNAYERLPHTGAVGTPNNWFVDTDAGLSGAALWAPNWHIFGCSWSASAITWSVDGVDQASVPSGHTGLTGPTTNGNAGTQRFTGAFNLFPYRSMLILMFAVGGASGTLNGASLPLSMDVDFVRFYRDP